MVVASGRETVTTLCRECGGLGNPAAPNERCDACGSPRLVRHRELGSLSIAHVDCDAFYATVEKRNRPELADRPVIIGGGARGVVLACCYVARLYGVRSAMPMFKALAACPDAVVIRPDMAKYREVGRQVRAEMLRLTPLVEPLSIDEAFLDLGGTDALHGARPAQLLAKLAKRVETALGITVSIGLSDNKFLAKIASDLDKPRGFAVLSGSEAPHLLASKPVSLLWGVGTAMQQRLAGDGITLIGQLANLGDRELASRYGRIGARIARLSRGEDDRAVLAHAPARTISAETTLMQDEVEADALSRILWPLCERVSARLKQASLAAGTITLKLKTADFQLRTRSRRMTDPTQLAATLFQIASGLLAIEVNGVTRFRLVGVGADHLSDSGAADPPTLFDREIDGPKRLEHAIDDIRGRLGEGSVGFGRDLPPVGAKALHPLAPPASGDREEPA
jgi:DNA polymerase IV